MASFGNRVAQSLLLVHLSQSIIAAAKLLVTRSREGLAFVPQDISVDVTKLNIERNNIKVLNSTSFSLFDKMRGLDMDRNPLEIINNGTFDNNPRLAAFDCYMCKIKVLPATVGPYISRVQYLAWHRAVRDRQCLTSRYFESLISLTSVGMADIKFGDINDINFPPSIRTLSLINARLSHFPNMSSQRFPDLRTLYIGENNFRNISDSTLAGMNSGITSLNLESTKLVEIGNVAIFTQLQYLSLRSNKLETIPDLLSLLQLRTLHIRDNTRLTCDRRMCWRGMWDRVRSRLFNADNAECKAPPAVRGYPLSRINPAFMECDQGG